MHTIYFDPNTPHKLFWDKWIEADLKKFFRHMGEYEKQLLTVQLIQDALEVVFLSIEEVPGISFEDHIHEAIPDLRDLYSHLVETKRIERDDPIQTRRTYVDGDSGEKTVVLGLREHIPTASTIIYSAFGNAFDELVGWLEGQIIKTFKHNGWGEFNTYAIVTLKPCVSRNGKLELFGLEIGDDIRHVFFRKIFGSGRYSSRRRSVRGPQTTL